MFRDNIHIGKWKDKREVLYITSEFPNKMENVRNRRGQEKLKPKAIIEYKFMSGVDRQDQMLAYYPLDRNTLRWYKQIIAHTIHILLLNSHKLYNRYAGHDKKMPFYGYRIAVINALLPRKLPTTTISATHKLKKFTELVNDKGKGLRVNRKRCCQCQERKIEKRTPHFCNGCEEQPGLYVDCFEPFHQNQQ